MLQHSTVNGHAAIFLENDLLRIGVLPEKGGDVFDFTYKSKGGASPVQLLMQTPWGLKPPGEKPQADFLDNYEGGWQELFPNANDACSHKGIEIPFHGEVTLLPWTWETDADSETKLRLRVDCRRSPFRLEREMRLPADEGRLVVHERVTNLGSQPADFVWGHHLTLGGDFLEDGCCLEIPAHEVYTPELLYEPLRAKLRPGQVSAWPFAESRDGQSVDLRYIPGPEARSHDDVILGGLEQGCYKVTNPRLKLSFTLEWDVHIFPWLMFWQPYGGADLPPLTGIYGIGLEPWVARFPLSRAVEEGQARRLEAGASLETELIASIEALTG
jgi:galactose mutarotase-like enzyme